MDTKILIGKFIAKLPERRVFVTRELLTFGLRSTVDCVTSSMVGKGLIIRLANGVFVRNDEGVPLPTLEEIIEAKARSFARKVNPLGVHLAKQFKLKPKPRKHVINKKTPIPGMKTEPIVASYAILGCTSSFRTIYGRVQFRHTPGRKFFLAEGVASKILVAWWASEPGENFVDLIQSHLFRLGKRERRRFREVGAWAPAWISDLLLEDPLRFATQAMTGIYPHTTAVDLGRPPLQPTVAEPAALYLGVSLREIFQKSCESPFWGGTAGGAHTKACNNIAVGVS